MTNEYIRVEKVDGVGILTLNRPEVLNAMNNELSNELYEAVVAMNSDDDIGCIVITGEGNRAFSAGGDIHQQKIHATELTEEQRDQNSAVRSQQGYEISASPKPVIGMMNGLAYGGGAVLASSLDFQVKAEVLAASRSCTPSWSSDGSPRLRFKGQAEGQARRVGLFQSLFLAGLRPVTPSSAGWESLVSSPSRTETRLDRFSSRSRFLGSELVPQRPALCFARSALKRR